MRRIPLRDRHGHINHWATVDDEDYEYLMQWKWYLSFYGYAIANSYVGNKRTMIQMHRIINKTPKGLDTDHKNRKRKLDNRKSNLRTLTRSKNMMNTGLQSNNTSGHKGICWDKRRGRWKVRIGVGGKKLNIGRFRIKKDAVNARKAAETLYHVL